MRRRCGRGEQVSTPPREEAVASTVDTHKVRVTLNRLSFWPAFAYRSCLLAPLARTYSKEGDKKDLTPCALLLFRALPALARRLFSSL